MSAAHDERTEIDSVCPHGPEDEQPEGLEYAQALHSDGMVGMIYSRFHGETEWIQADADAFIDLEVRDVDD